MAEENAEATEGKKKSKLMLIILIVVGVLVVGGAGAGAAFFFLSGDSDAEEAKEEMAAEPVRLPAIYTKIRTKEGRPMFVSTLISNDGKSHYMQAYVEAKSRDPLVDAELQKHMPLIVSKLNSMFSSQEFAKLGTLEGKQNLRRDATELVQQILQERMGRPGIEKILFTNFVMQ